MLWQGLLAGAAERQQLDAVLPSMRAVLDPAQCRTALLGARSWLAGKPQAVLALAERAGPGDDTDRLLADCATQLWANGRIDDAIATAARVDLGSLRQSAFAGLLHAALDRHGADASLQLMKRFPADRAGPEALFKLIQTLTKEGRITEAETVALHADLGEVRDYRYEALVSALAGQGEIDRALRLTERVGDVNRREHLRQTVAEAAAIGGKLEQALQIVERRPDGWARDNGLVITARVLAQNGAFDEAEQLIARVAGPPRRDEARAAIALAAAEAGQQERATRLADAALQSAEAGYDSGDVYFGPLRDFALGLVRVKRPELALRVASEIAAGSWLRSDTMRAVARAWQQSKICRVRSPRWTTPGVRRCRCRRGAPVPGRAARPQSRLSTMSDGRACGRC